MKTRIPYLYVLLLISVATAGFQSCTKTEYTDYEAEPLNHILEYRITDTQQELSGAINNDDNTITLYIPYYLGLDYLNAEIKLDEGATLLDSAGKEINLDGGLEPVRVSPDSVKVQYTVVPEIGDKRTYTLIQKVLPYPEELKAAYVGMEDDEEEFIIGVNFYMDVVGDFQSTSTNAKIILTDKSSGKVHEDFIRPVSMEVGENAAYTLKTFISPEAEAGEYKVRVEHQGRSTDLPDLKLVYTRSKPNGRWFTVATGNVTPGDTVTFEAGYVASIFGSYDGGIILPVDRVYIKILRDFPGYYGNFQVPDGFPEALFGKEIEMKIVDQTRTELTCIVPELPAGSYKGSKNSRSVKHPREDGRERSETEYSNFGFYVDWAEDTGWGKGFMISSLNPVLFTVNEKK